MEKYYLTTEGVEKLRNELAELKGPGRESLSKRLRTAIQQGDLSENADYISIKEEQGFLEGRIQDLEIILSDYIVIDELEQNPDVIGIGDIVTIQEDSYPVERYRLVGPKEADPKKNMISRSQSK